MMPGPLVIAHRAGNDLGALRAAEALGVDLVEADVHLFRRRIEVRHLKTLGPIPILWDRWRIASPWTPRMELRQLLEQARPETCLLLDLKGPRTRLAHEALAEIRRHRDRRPVAVCARNWRLLRPFAHEPGVRVIHTIATGRMLRRVLARGMEFEAVSIDERLLTSAAVGDLKQRVRLIVAWGVADLARAHALLTAGVGGFITADPGVLRALVAAGDRTGSRRLARSPDARSHG